MQGTSQFVKDFLQANDGEKFELNVRGDTEGFTISKALLCSVPGSRLEDKFSGRHPIQKENGKVLMDRDPAVFRDLVNFLRNPTIFPVFENKAY